MTTRKRAKKVPVTKAGTTAKTKAKATPRRKIQDALTLAVGPFEIYLDVGRGWRWRLKDANHRIIADSAEAYVSRANAERAVLNVWNDLVRLWVEGLSDSIDEKIAQRTARQRA